MKAKEIEGKLEERRKELGTIFEEAGEDLDLSQVKCIEGDSTAKAEKIREINEECADLAKQLESHNELAKMQRENDERGELKAHPGHAVKGEKGREEREEESLADQVYEQLGDDGAVGLKRREVMLPDVEVKTLFQTSAGWAPESIRTGRLVDAATRPVQVTDLVPSSTTNSAAIKYMEETTFTNAAVEVAEGASKPEAALALTERTESVQKIAVWIAATDEQLEDEPQVRGYINRRLPFMVEQRLDGQILIGDGTTPNLSGILDRSGLQTQAKGSDPVPDATYKAMTKVRVTGRAMPSGVVYHPNDWQDVRLLRTTDGIYIWGSPSEAGPERIWGLQVVQSDALTEGTGLVGDFANFSELAFRTGIKVDVGLVNDQFIKNQQTLRAEVRAALLVYRPAAFCQITGI